MRFQMLAVGAFAIASSACGGNNTTGPDPVVTTPPPVVTTPPPVVTTPPAVTTPRTVTTTRPSGTVSMRWSLSDGCSDGRGLQAKFFDRTNNLVWPDAGRVYVSDPGSPIEVTL